MGIRDTQTLQSEPIGTVSGATCRVYGEANVAVPLPRTGTP